MSSRRVHDRLKWLHLRAERDRFRGVSARPISGTDGCVSVSLVIRAAQSNNSGRYVDQTLSLTIADLPELMQIHDGSGLHASPEGPEFSFIRPALRRGSLDRTISMELKIHLIIPTSYQRHPMETASLVLPMTKCYSTGDGYRRHSSKRVPGYRWENALPATGWIGSGIRFLQDLPPVVLDLNGDGQFGVPRGVLRRRRDGTRDRVAWISAGRRLPGARPRPNGMIDSGAEISFLADKPGATSDLEGLSAYDSNHDDRSRCFRRALRRLPLWQDSNQDGVSDDGELKTLAEAGVVSISLDRTANPLDARYGEPGPARHLHLHPGQRRRRPGRRCGASLGDGTLSAGVASRFRPCAGSPSIGRQRRDRPGDRGRRPESAARPASTPTATA